jgi:hypothetical protein
MLTPKIVDPYKFLIPNKVLPSLQIPTNLYLQKVCPKDLSSKLFVYPQKYLTLNFVSY